VGGGGLLGMAVGGHDFVFPVLYLLLPVFTHVLMIKLYYFKNVLSLLMRN
jgi:hypothetical protein